MPHVRRGCGKPNRVNVGSRPVSRHARIRSTSVLARSLVKRSGRDRVKSSLKPTRSRIIERGRNLPTAPAELPIDKGGVAIKREWVSLD